MNSKLRDVAVIVRGERFDCQLRGLAWQVPEGRTAVDATIEIHVVSKQNSTHEAVFLLHGHVVRPDPAEVFSSQLDELDVVGMIEIAFEVWVSNAAAVDFPVAMGWPGSRLRMEDIRDRMDRCPLRETVAMRFVAPALRQRVAAACGVADEPDMQDWPCEVADPHRLLEFCAYYDRVTAHDLRFAAMALVLHSYEYLDDKSPWFDWIERTLRCDFAIHGHTFATWAALDADSEAPELRGSSHERVFASSLQLRRIWDETLVPIAIAWR